MFPGVSEAEAVRTAMLRWCEFAVTLFTVDSQIGAGEVVCV